MWGRVEEEKAVCDFSDFNDGGAKECRRRGKERDVGYLAMLIKKPRYLI